MFNRDNHLGLLFARYTVPISATRSNNEAISNGNIYLVKSAFPMAAILPTVLIVFGWCSSLVPQRINKNIFNENIEIKKKEIAFSLCIYLDVFT